ncbi:MAG: DnaJ domain-containing protein [Actinomycetales bacterium]|nr:DnaJ domain-containing protein [Actinomycetales bacterium]
MTQGPASSDAAGEPDPYVVLGVPRDADPQAIARAYRAAVRAAHPDSGGSAEEFHAVQRAWSLLGDPERRAGYDATGANDWAGADWGASDDDAASSSVPPTDGPARTVDPFEPGAVPLPPLDLGTEPRGFLPSVTDRQLVLTAATSTGVVVVTGLVAGARVSGAAYAVVAALVFFTGVGVLVGRAFGAPGVVPWVGAAVVMCGTLVVGARQDGLGPDDVVILVAAALGCSAVAFVLGRRRRPGRPRSARPAGRVGGLVERHRLAGEWNRLRDALLVPGTHLERVEAPAVHEGAGRWLLSDPRTGRAVLRVLADEYPLGSWLVLDARGRVVVVAPPAAMKSWRKVMAGGRRG